MAWTFGHVGLEGLAGPPRCTARTTTPSISPSAERRGGRLRRQRDADAHPVPCAWITGAVVHRLDLEAHDVRPGLGEIVEEALGGLHLEVGMQRQGGVRPQACHDRRPDRERRDEVGIHHIDVDEVGMALDQLYLGGQVRKVGGQDRCGELAHGG
jgi:hypothetical protein